MRDTRDIVEIGDLHFYGVRQTWDNGTRGYIELLDYYTREPFARVVHPGPGEPLQIVGYGQSIPRFVIESLLERAKLYLV